ncbi:MAG: hypothetical protein IPJ54_18430 [Saprospiraceae bacterium]|nr:hypothetical protein [Saprospiraceae bacterium]
MALLTSCTGAWERANILENLNLKFRNRDFVTRTRAVSRPYVIQTADELRALAHQLVNDNASLMTDVRLLGLTILQCPGNRRGPSGQMRLPPLKLTLKHK